MGIRAFAFAVIVLAACGPAPVTFSALAVEPIEAQSARVTFETSIAAPCEVEYGLEPTALNQVATDPSMDAAAPVKQHAVWLAGLSPSTRYFVRARITHDGAVSRSPIEQFTTLAAGEKPNLALLSAGASVTAVSSNFGGTPNEGAYGANKALDGSMGTEWSSNGDGDNAFLEVDLGATRPLGAVGVRSRQMTDGSSIVTSITLSLDGVPLGQTFQTPDPSQRYLLQLPAGTQARRLRLEVETSTGGNTGLRELQAFGP